MASGQTTNYKLNQWQPEDKVLREEFNADNSKVEEALTGLAGQIGTKASQAEVDGVKTQLAAKAAQTSLDSLSSQLTANTSSLQSQINAKAAQTSLDALSNQLATNTNSLQSQINTKAAQSTMTSELAKKYGTDNPYIKTGTYVGTGSGNVSVTLGFRPSYVMVIPVNPSYNNTNFALMHGTAVIQVTVRSVGETITETSLLQFTDTGFVVVYNTGVNLNKTGMTYHYFAFR